MPKYECNVMSCNATSKISQRMKPEGPKAVKPENVKHERIPRTVKKRKQGKSADSICVQQ